MVIGSYAAPDHRGMPRVWSDVLSYIWAVGLLGVATCLADRTADRFKSDTVHHRLSWSLRLGSA